MFELACGFNIRLVRVDILMLEQKEWVPWATAVIQKFQEKVNINFSMASLTKIHLLANQWVGEGKDKVACSHAT